MKSPSRRPSISLLLCLIASGALVCWLYPIHFGPTDMPPRTLAECPLHFEITSIPPPDSSDTNVTYEVRAMTIAINSAQTILTLFKIEDIDTAQFPLQIDDDVYKTLQTTQARNKEITLITAPRITVNDDQPHTTHFSLLPAGTEKKSWSNQSHAFLSDGSTPFSTNRLPDSESSNHFKVHVGAEPREFKLSHPDDPLIEKNGRTFTYTISNDMLFPIDSDIQFEDQKHLLWIWKSDKNNSRGLPFYYILTLKRTLNLPKNERPLLIPPYISNTVK